jgi:two-component system, NarL family, nitrate/nitrite response regulator NarL
MDTSEIRIGVVDDHPIFRDGARRTLMLEEDFKVIGEGESADDAIALCDKFRPDVVIIDMKMPGGGLKAVTEIHRRHPSIGIVVMTVEDFQDSVSAALAAGARGYLLKGGAAQELIDAVRVVSAGGTYVTPDLAVALLFSGDVRPEPPKEEAHANLLSERERQVFVLLGKGRSNKEIAAELGLSEKTAKWYVSCVMSKLGLVSRLQVAIAAGYQDKDGLDVAAPRA